MYLFLIWSSYLTVVRQANPLLGALKGEALEIETFLGPEMATREDLPVY
jgi:hypothetical protein